MKNNNKLCELLNIKYPIIQGGMVWCSGNKLASAVALNGGLGVLGAGSMKPDVLHEHLRKIPEDLVDKTAVNIPLFSPYAAEQIELVKQSRIRKIISSAGNPGTYTSDLKENGFVVLHVVANEKFAKKALDAGVDGLIAEGFEAGGHNGRDETTTMCLVPQLRKLTEKPLVAAGGIATGQAIVASMALGADGVQIGSRFAIAKESSAHQIFKETVVSSTDGGTVLTLKELTPVRLLKTKFWKEIAEAYENGAKVEELRSLLGKGRSKKGIFEGNIEEGELEIGQVAAQIDKVESVAQIFDDLILSFNKTTEKLDFKL